MGLVCYRALGAQVWKNGSSSLQFHSLVESVPGYIEAVLVATFPNFCFNRATEFPQCRGQDFLATSACQLKAVLLQRPSV